MIRDVFCSSILLAIMTNTTEALGIYLPTKVQIRICGFSHMSVMRKKHNIPIFKEVRMEVGTLPGQGLQALLSFFRIGFSSTSDSYVSPEINEFLLWRCTNWFEVVAVPRLIVSSKVCIALSRILKLA
jgi:hypothetical protein